MIQTIIGLNGRLHSGKDTAYEYIERYFLDTGLKTKRVAFADPLKLSGVLALGFLPKSVEEAVDIANRLKENHLIIIAEGDDGDEEFQPTGEWITGREFWQFYGTEAHRNVFGQDFWVDATLPDTKTLDARHPDVDVLVVTDVRFDNEAERILDHFGYVFYIDAEERLGALPDDAHVSERGVSESLITNVVENNGSIEDFYRSLDTALEGV